MKPFNETADQALQAIRQRAEELNLQGVAVVAAGEGDRVQSWSSKMLVVGAMKRRPAEGGPEVNLIAIACSKLAEMADTLQASGSGVRPPLTGEFGFQGGVIARGKKGYVLAAFSGGPGADDVKAAQAGLEVLIKTSG